MSHERNPQAEQMAHESMLRTLAAQAECIWPSEQALLARYALQGALQIADVGCGSGEITARLARLYPEARVLGLDILESSVALAAERHSSLAPRLRFQQGDAFELQLESGAYDLVVCRHLTQAVPEPKRVLAELHRICKPGAWLHVLSEDYGMLHFPFGPLDADRLWRDGVFPFARATGTDARVGRHTWSYMKQLALEELRVDYVVVDTLRAPRGTFAQIFEAWRDGYAQALGQKSNLTPAEAHALFDHLIASIRDENSYAVWHVPVLSGRKSR
ncbi:MAG TPA: methyltransferase domain-containing protein [Polyangiaceae bacterium]|nr:methyltransferase domain-containing protein [Polyangiaceae bacterium]